MPVVAMRNPLTVLLPHSRSKLLALTSREPSHQRGGKRRAKEAQTNASCTSCIYSLRCPPRLSSFIQLWRSAVPAGSPAPGRGGAGEWATGAETGRARREQRQAAGWAGERDPEPSASRWADWPWPPMCLCLCGSRCGCQHAPKVSARQRASAPGHPIAAPPRSPDSWPALALVYFRPDVTSRADFKVGTVLLSPW